LVRAAERQKELAVRLAIGAGRLRIVRQMLTESLLLAGMGGGVGLLLGRWMLAGVLMLAPPEIPHLSRAGLDNTVLLFTLGIAALTSLLFGFLPALRASRTDFQSALKDGGRLTTGAVREGMRKALLIAEVGLSLVLLVGAGLLVRSMYNLLHVDPGFDADNLLTMRLELSDKKYNPQTWRVFYDECLARLRAVPGVRSVALSQSLPIEGSYWSTVFNTADQPIPSRADLPETDYLLVSPDYLETMGIRLQRGRWFSIADTPESVPVAVINETLSRHIWPGQNPIGKRIKPGYPEVDEEWREVIGVVSDIKLNGVERDTSMQTYVPFSQVPGSSFGLIVRTQGNPLATLGSVQQAIHTVDKDLPIYSIWTMDQLLRNSLSRRKLTLVLLGSFAMLALLLAAVGIYGVISYTVRQRTHELGIRLALGARASDVLKMILGEGMRLTLIGIALGLGGAYALTKYLESLSTLLYGVRATDPLTFAGTALILLIVALVACFLPARRATKVDPLKALRYE
jgi:putative ABC transport system permease protein